MKTVTTLVLFLLIVIHSPAEAWWIRVGNGAEGIHLNGKIYFRDLYENGAHLQPYVAETILERVAERWSRSPLRGLFLKQESTLLKKLSELEALQPGLAALLITGLERYDFVFTSDELVNEFGFVDASQIYYTNRVALATRLNFQIYIAKDYWEELSPESQVALLLHEIFYAFSELNCNMDTCSQSAFRIRSLVGQLFKKERAASYSAELLSALELTELRSYCAQKNFTLSVQFSTPLSAKIFYLDPHLLTADGHIQRACEMFTSSGADAMTYSFSHSFLALENRVYTTVFRPLGKATQIALVLNEKTELLTKHIKKSEAVHCRQTLREDLTSFTLATDPSLIAWKELCYSY